MTSNHLSQHKLDTIVMQIMSYQYPTLSRRSTGHVLSSNYRHLLYMDGEHRVIFISGMGEGVFVECLILDSDFCREMLYVHSGND